MTDTELNTTIEAVLSGRRDEFTRLVREYGLVVRGFLHTRVHHAEDAEDIAQEVFIAAYRDLARFRRGESFQAWLIGIARNRLLMHMRTTGRRKSALDKFRQETMDIIEPEMARYQSPLESEQLERLLSCIESLPKRMRKIVKAGLASIKAGQLAAELETSPGAIYNLQWRANRILRECMQKTP